jgi:hypothetical protein
MYAVFFFHKGEEKDEEAKLLFILNYYVGLKNNEVGA